MANHVHNLKSLASVVGWDFLWPTYIPN